MDPMNIQKRFGDGYYEQQLVMQRLRVKPAKQTAIWSFSRRTISPVDGCRDCVTKSQSIVLGRGLTESEQKNLKEDVVLQLM